MDRTATLLEAADVLRSEINIEMLPNERVEYDQEVGALRPGINEQMFDFARNDGRSMAMEEAIEIALTYSE